MDEPREGNQSSQHTVISYASQPTMHVQDSDNRVPTMNEQLGLETASTISTSLINEHSFREGFRTTSISPDLHSESAMSSRQKPELPFSELGLIGRSQEEQTLQQVVDDVCRLESGDPQHLMALISGPSGSGKSALARSFQRQCFNRHAFFVTGKFDLKQMEEPYSGIKAALTDLCRQMLALQQGSDDSTSSICSRSGCTDDSEDPRRFSDLQSLLTEGLLAGEVQALSKVIPEILDIVKPLSTQNKASQQQRSPSFTSIVSDSATESHHVDANRMGYREQSDRLKFVMRRVLQISCQFCPVIMVIDDLQWGDKASMDLLKSWMFMDTDGVSGHSLLIMGSFRSEASDHSPILQETIEELKNAQDARSINIVEVDLDDMRVSQVHELVCGLLLPFKNLSSASDSSSKSSTPAIIGGGHETLALARIVHKRTGGNVFFIKQYLKQLCQDGLIYYDKLSDGWAWKSEAELLEKSAATTNIVDMMKAKLAKIQAARQILPIAACLGATFSKSKLTTVIRSLSIHSDHSTFFRGIFDMPRQLEDSRLDAMLRSCEREGLIESHHLRNERMPTAAKQKSKKRTKRRSQNDRHELYSFVHDKIQEASFALIPADSVTELQYRVGEVLSSCLTPSELEDNIFMVASLINLRHDMLPHVNRGDRRMKIAMLNSMAGERAVSCGAFQTALFYFKTAISLLPEDHWKSQFEDSLNLYSSVAECSFVTSDMEQVHTYSTQVINQDCPILDKIRAYHILMDASSAEVENNKQFDPPSLCLFVLAELGCKFPQNTLMRTATILRGMLKMKRCVPKWTLQQFDDLPVCTDPKELAIAKTLSKLSTIAYIFKPDIVPWVILKLVERTLKYGISPYSLSSFSFLGLIVGYFMGDFDSARKLGQISLRLMIKVDCPATKSSSILFAHALCLHWTSPIEDLKEPHSESYRIGMANGEIDSACWSIYQKNYAQLLMGTPLPTLEDDLSRYTKVAKDFHLANQQHVCAIMWQMVQNFRGKTEHRTDLIGDAYDSEAELQRLEREPNPQRLLSIQGMRMYAATHFGDFAIGAKIAQATCKERLEKNAGAIELLLGMFISGMCCYAACSLKDVPSKLKKKYLKTAKICRAKLHDWQAKGSPNCDHYVAMLDAEQYYLKGKDESATKHYAIAITLANRRGYIQDEALAHERLAEHLLKGESPGNNTNARQCVARAIDLREEWGATAKVSQLREDFAELLAASPNSTSP